MADENLQQTPGQANQGPPPSGGGSFDGDNSRLRSTWHQEVLGAFEELHPGVYLDNASLDKSQPYRSMDRWGKIHRRQLEQLTIARKLYRVVNGTWAPSSRALKDFLGANFESINSLWQREVSLTSLTGIPKFFNDNYTIAETENWLADRGLFGLKKGEEKPGAVIDISQRVPTPDTEEKKTQTSKVEKNTQKPPATSPVMRPRDAQSSLDDDYDDDEGVALPGGLAGTRVNRFASAAKPGGARLKMSELPGGSKRSQRRKRGKGRETAKRATGTQEEEITGSVQTSASGGSAKAQASYAGQAEAEGQSSVFGEAAVSNKIPRAKITAETNAEAIADDTSTPGFAESRAQGGESDEFVTPGVVQQKSSGGVSASGKVTKTEVGVSVNTASGGTQGGASTVAGLSGQETDEGNTLQGGSSGTKTASGKRAVLAKEAQSGGAKQSARPTLEAEEQAAESAVLEKKSASGTGKGGEDADLEVETEEEAPQDVPVQPASNTPTPEEVAGASVEDDDYLRPQESQKQKKSKDRLAEQKAGPLAEQQGITASGAKGQAEKTGEQPEGDDYLAPQFAPDEYQTPEQKAQADAQKKASENKDAERDRSRADGGTESAEEDEEEDPESLPMGDPQALGGFNNLSTGDQLNFVNQWLGQNTAKKKRIPSISAWKMRLLEAAALKYPELKELLEEVKVEAYKAAKGLSEERRRPKKERPRSLEDEFMYWVQRIVAEYVMKVYVFPYGSLSALIDGGIQAVIVFFLLHIYWLISFFTDNPWFKGLVRWQKWVIAGIDAALFLLLTVLIFALIYGFCQMPGVQLGSEVASYLTSDKTYTFCADLNGSIGGMVGVSTTPPTSGQ